VFLYLYTVKMADHVITGGRARAGPIVGGLIFGFISGGGAVVWRRPNMQWLLWVFMIMIVFECLPILRDTAWPAIENGRLGEEIRGGGGGPRRRAAKEQAHAVMDAAKRKAAGRCRSSTSRFTSAVWRDISMNFVVTRQVVSLIGPPAPARTNASTSSRGFMRPSEGEIRYAESRLHLKPTK